MGKIQPVPSSSTTSGRPYGRAAGLGTARDAEALEAAADGVLTGRSSARSSGPKPAKSPKSARWSMADAVLIDEAGGLIDRLPSFGHVVVDEAQDLSPMQARAIARRSEHGSITLLGDLAQGTAPWAARDWRSTLEHLGKPGARIVPLTIGFRVPAAVVDLANRLLPALGVDVPEARSLRPRGALLRTSANVGVETTNAVREAFPDGVPADTCAAFQGP